MTVKLLTEHNLEFLSLTGGCTGLSESTLVKSHVTAHMLIIHIKCQMSQQMKFWFLYCQATKAQTADSTETSLLTYTKMDK